MQMGHASCLCNMGAKVINRAHISFTLTPCVECRCQALNDVTLLL